MTYEFLRSVPISSDFTEMASQLLAEESANFTKLVKAAGIDPAFDLVGTDLHDVNFSECDLRGFNFTGCDLRGSFGANVIFDDTTNFKGADIKGSLFSYFQEVQSFSDGNLEREYQRLRSNYWGSICDWIAENVSNTVASEDRAMAIRLFFDVKDLTVKTDILLRLRRLFVNTDDYRRFLVNIILRESDDIRAVRSAMQAASGIINSDRFLFRMILSYLRNAEYGLTVSLMSKLINSIFFSESVEEIRGIVDIKSDYPLRSLFLRRLNLVFRCCRDEYLQIGEKQYIDYKKPLDVGDLKRILNLNSSRLAREKVQSLRGQTKMTEKEIISQVRFDMAKNILDGLRRFEIHNLHLTVANYAPEEIV